MHVNNIKKTNESQGDEPQLKIEPVQVDQLIEYPDLSKSKRPKPLATSSNFVTLLKHIGLEIAKNQMNMNLDVKQNGVIFEPSYESLRSILIDECSKSDLPIAAIDHHLVAIGERASYHPVAAALDGLCWDGVERVQRVLDCMPCTDPMMRNSIMKKWLISAIAAVYEQHFSSKLVPVLKGGQSTYKSTFLSRVCSIVEGSFLPESPLDPENKDNLITVTGHHIVELSELERSTRKEVGAVKAFITKDVDNFRPPYGRVAIKKKRRTVMIGTVNNDEFLKDISGNSRFTVIEVTGRISLDDVNEILGYSYDNGRVRQMDRGQLLQFWLEVKHWYDTCLGWILNESELKLSEHNNIQYMIKGDYYHIIMEKIDFWWKDDYMGISASEIAGLLGLNASYAGKIGKDLAQLTKDGVLKSGEGRDRRKYFKA